MKSERTRSRDLSTEDILAHCRKGAPVNATLKAAIPAHRIAFAQYQQHPGDEAARTLAQYALVAVLMVCRPTVEDYQTQLDYVSGLPDEAWIMDEPDYGPQKFRETTIAAISNNLVIWKGGPEQ